MVLYGLMQVLTPPRNLDTAAEGTGDRVKELTGKDAEFSPLIEVSEDQACMGSAILEV